MSSRKRTLVKKWDKPRNIMKVKPSRFEQNEASVKVHWRKVVRDLELSYKDDQFWESQTDTVRELVGPIIFQRFAKIFNLPLEAEKYKPASEVSSLVPSEIFYKDKTPTQGVLPRSTYSMSDFVPSSIEEEEQETYEDESDQWTPSSQQSEALRKSISRVKSLTQSKSRSVSRAFSSKLSSKMFSKLLMRNLSGRKSTKSLEFSTSDDCTYSEDDLEVNYSKPARQKLRYHTTKNPHHDMLYCSESETDMIKWKSKYRQKTLEVSASDEFSKKAEIMTKKISTEFFEWWTGLGNLEFKSEIRRPEDIEALFQVWFDEHASRGLVLNPKILPCVLESIANFVGVPNAACPKVLKRQIAYDIHAETSPAHVMAFGTCLPQKMKHIPPKNNTKAMWDCVRIPEDLRTMSCVWDEVSHLTSTKAFQKWLEQRPYLPMPECLRPQQSGEDKKQLFVVPSDYVDRSTLSTQELALPVSQFSLELKAVLSKLMNQS